MSGKTAEQQVCWKRAGEEVASSLHMGDLGAWGVSVTSGLFTLDSFAFLSLQMTPQCRYYTASVTVLLLASSHWPGRCCYCRSCCYRPHEDGATSGLRSGTGRRVQGQALLPCPCWSQSPSPGTHMHKLRTGQCSGF